MSSDLEKRDSCKARKCYRPVTESGPDGYCCNICRDRSYNRYTMLFHSPSCDKDLKGKLEGLPEWTRLLFVRET